MNDQGKVEESGGISLKVQRGMQRPSQFVLRLRNHMLTLLNYISVMVHDTMCWY